MKSKQGNMEEIELPENKVNNPPMPTTPWVLDALKVAYGLKTDEQLAGYLGITKGAMSQLRRGKTTLSPITMLKALDRLGYRAATEVLQLLTPERLAKEIEKYTLNQAQRIADQGNALTPKTTNTRKPKGGSS